MSQSSKLRWDRPSTIMLFCTIMILLILVSFTPDCHSQTVEKQQPVENNSGISDIYETPGLLKAHEILPPALMEGKYYSVLDDIVTYDFTNSFMIASAFGQFEAIGEGMLRIRINEIQAIATLQEMKQTKEFLNAVKQSKMSLFKGKRNLITQPADTLSGMPKSMGRLFSQVDEMSMKGRSELEDIARKELVGFSRVKRHYAHKLGVDAYSSNKILQKELNSVAWAAFAVSPNEMSNKDTSKTDYVPVKETEFIHDINRIILNNGSKDIQRISRKKLKQMKIEGPIIEEFLQHPRYTPRSRTIIVHALAEMEGVKNRDQFIKQANFAVFEEDALFFQQIAAMLASYHKNVGPFSELVTVRQMVVGYTAGQSIVATLPIDYVCWTERAALGTKALTGLKSVDFPVKRIELWITGIVTSRAMQELETSGIIVKERIGDALMVADAIKEDIKRSEKPREDGLITDQDIEKNITRQYIDYQEPEFLSYEELKGLYYNPLPAGLFSGGHLKDKVHRFFRTPIINNRPYYRGVKPHRPVSNQIGPFLRVASWNIEKSINVKDAIAVISSEEELHERINLSEIKDDQELNTILNQRKKLATADIIVLQEMEIGLKRSGYLNAAGELAKALEMNYAYAPQYLEIDPVQLGLEKIYLKDGQVDEEATKHFSTDKELYKGVFGSAVLSRYPIKNVTVIPLRNQGYDWYAGEKEKTAFLEKARRLGSKTVFLNEITREIKIGGRHFFRVDLDVPDIPGNTLTIVNIHLEIKCLPKARERQIAEILNYIKDIDNPVIMLGDFNAAPVDLSPTSVPRSLKRKLKDPSTYISLAPHGLAIKAIRGISNYTKNMHNPLAPHVPIVAPNPVKKMFDMIEDFRFEDGGAFDFRGDKEHSLNGKEGKLANSNQKDIKAFKTTYSVIRPLVKVIGKYRLDWIFVKSYLKDPLDPEGPYRLAPHYGETLTELNNNLYEKISDHDPSVVDLPLLGPSQ